MGNVYKTNVRFYLASSHVGKIDNKMDDEKLFTALMTLRDNSRVGFMVAYARLVQLALAAETPLALKAQYCLVAYQNPKYKSKMTQVKHVAILCKE